MTKVPYPSLGVDAWPEPDRHLWRKALEPVDIFDTASVTQAWRPDTVELVERSYGQFLSCLESLGLLDASATPLERTSEATIRQFIAAFSVGRAERTVAITLTAIADMVRACHPPVGLPWLNSLARRLKKRARPARSIHARSATIDELLWLGELLVQQGRRLRSAGSARDGAVAFRDGLIILTLTVDPVRRRNLAAFQLNQTFFAGEHHVRVSIAGYGTKTGRSHICRYPTWLSELFQEYLANVRPQLLKLGHESDHGWVWVGRNGTRLREETFRIITTSHTLRHLGRVVPPHNFRHSTMSDMARLEPTAVGIAADILDHASFRTTERYYIMAKSFDAFARYDAIVEERRKGNDSVDR